MSEVRPDEFASQVLVELLNNLNIDPGDIDDAVRAVNDYGLFREIKRVNIRKEGKYWNVIGVGF